MRKYTGFTLIELMIVIAIIAIIAAIAIPNLLSARLNSNETAAIATLRNIISAQAQFQSTARADENNNGVGEYGTFGELSGNNTVRADRQHPQPARPLDRLPRGQRRARAPSAAAATSSACSCPGPPVTAFPRHAGGGLAAGSVDADLCETTWCAYAWPANYGNTGNRTFFVNQGGDIVATESSDYSGGNVPDPDSAFRKGSAGGAITGLTATGTSGNDDNFWKQAG